MKNLALNKKPIESWDNSENVTSEKIIESKYAATHIPDNFTIDLEKEKEIENIRFLLYYKDNREYKYRLLTSIDNHEWKVHFETEKNTIYHGWQDLYFTEKIKARYLRIHAYYNSKNRGFHIIHFAAYNIKPTPINHDKKNEITISTKTTPDIEIGDGYPLSLKLKELTIKLESFPENIPGLDKEYFTSVARELRIGANDVAKIEQSLESVRREIINPVNRELKRGNKIGKSSIILGMIGGAIGLFSILNNIFEWI